ncbi:hypothetical protein FGB62_44g10 [Gracilaria domingensis]|nr:hypothetical protein FGB62_44g10 [Gracilaria domingensis]
MYFFYSLRTSSTLPGRLVHVAKSLRSLKTLRVGSSTYHRRRGEQEIVVRSGARGATGEKYWRGKIDRQQSVGDGWLVYLVEEQMHTDLLSDLGTVEYARTQKANKDDLYRRVYQTVMNVEGVGDPRIDWTKFLSEYSAIAKTNMAVRAGATSDGDLAGVARRVAADACLYVAGKCPYRADVQIAIINSCVEETAREIANELQQESHNNN